MPNSLRIISIVACAAARSPLAPAPAAHPRRDRSRRRARPWRRHTGRHSAGRRERRAGRSRRDRERRVLHDDLRSIASDRPAPRRRVPRRRLRQERRPPLYDRSAALRSGVAAGGGQPRGDEALLNQAKPSSVATPPTPSTSSSRPSGRSSSLPAASSRRMSRIRRDAPPIRRGRR